MADTAPTVLDLLGLSVPPSYQGRSLLDGPTCLALFCTDYALGLLGLRGGWKDLPGTRVETDRLR